MTDTATVLMRCPAPGLEDGEVRKCQSADGQVIALYRQEGKFFATQDRCTHAMASLSEGWVEGYEVFCPAHDARFDIRTGKALCFPATEPLVTYDVTEIGDGHIEIREKSK